MFLSILYDGFLILILSSLAFRSWAKTCGVFKEVFKREKIRLPRN